MRNSLVAVIVAAVIAGAFTFLTEPNSGAGIGAAKSPTTGTTLPAGNETRPAERCLLIPESLEYRSDCVRGRVEPARRPSHGFIVLVMPRTIEPPYPPAA